MFWTKTLGLSLLLRGQTGFGGPTAERVTMETTRGDVQFPDEQSRKSQPQIPAQRFSRAPHLGVGVVGVPGGAQGLLAPDVPHQEARVVHHDLLHVAPDGGRGVNHLVHGAAQGTGTVTQNDP